jgi:hypothetical protein
MRKNRSKTSAWLLGVPIGMLIGATIFWMPWLLFRTERGAGAAEAVFFTFLLPALVVLAYRAATETTRGRLRGSLPWGMLIGVLAVPSILIVLGKYPGWGEALPMTTLDQALFLTMFPLAAVMVAAYEAIFFGLLASVGLLYYFARHPAPVVSRRERVAVRAPRNRPEIAPRVARQESQR